MVWIENKLTLYTKRHLEGDKFIKMLSIYLPFTHKSKGILISKVDKILSIELF